MQPMGSGRLSPMGSVGMQPMGSGRLSPMGSVADASSGRVSPPIVAGSGSTPPRVGTPTSAMCQISVGGVVYHGQFVQVGTAEQPICLRGHILPP